MSENGYVDRGGYGGGKTPNHLRAQLPRSDRVYDRCHQARPVLRLTCRSALVHVRPIVSGEIILSNWLKQFNDDSFIPHRRGKLHKGHPVETISCKIPSEMRQRLAEIVESRVDPEIRVYADIIRDALDKWIVEWDVDEDHSDSPEARYYRDSRIREEFYELEEREEEDNRLIEDLTKAVSSARLRKDTEKLEALSTSMWQLAMYHRHTNKTLVNRLMSIFPDWPEQFGQLPK